MGEAKESARDLFARLERPGDSPIKDLWPLEIDIIDRYLSESQPKRLVAIELPTGSGKSVIGLMILHSWLKRGKRVAMLTSSIALAQQLCQQAAQLGIDAVVITGGDTTDPIKNRAIKAYNRSLAIGIMNYWAYLYATQVTSADYLVIDDADSFESAAADHYNVSIFRSDDEGLWHDAVYELSKRELYKSKIDAFGFKESAEDALVVYFPDSYEIADHVRKQILASITTVSKSLRYSFLRNKNRLQTYPLFVTKDQVTFAPLVSPISAHERLSQASQIILMSATLGTGEMLQRILGTDEDVLMLTGRDDMALYGTMGVRLAFPLRGYSMSKELIQDALHLIRSVCQRYKKLAILCPSRPEGELVLRHLQANGYSPIQYLTDGDVEKFAKSSEGILVSGGRLTGLDLPDDVCRLAILTRLPLFVSIRDVVFDQIMGDKEFTHIKQANRLAQALGRCNRGPADYASYFIIDRGWLST